MPHCDGCRFSLTDKSGDKKSRPSGRSAFWVIRDQRVWARFRRHCGDGGRALGRWLPQRSRLKRHDAARQAPFVALALLFVAGAGPRHRFIKEGVMSNEQIVDYRLVFASMQKGRVIRFEKADWRALIKKT